jgi:outer membrane receptor for ferrienterochelin and colicins
MIRQFLALTLGILLATTASAQHIRIVDTEGNALPAITVSGGMNGITDAKGELTGNATKYPVSIQLSGLMYEPVIWNIKSDRPVTIVLNPRKNNLEETIVTGVPRPMKLQNALSQYRLITREEFRAQGSVTLADALATRLNISIANDNILGAGIKMQGMSGNKVKILIDGLPVNGREGGNIDLGQLNLNNIERIETVQGPMSIVYGSDALGGVINLITRKSAKSWEASAGFNYESIDKYNADFNVSRRWNRHQVLVGGGRNYFAGWNILDTAATLPKRRMEWKPKEQYFGNATYNYTAKSGFKAQLSSDYTHEKITDRGTAYVDPYRAYALDAYYRTNRLNTRLIMDKKAGKTGHWESRNSYALYYRTRQEVSKDLVTLNEAVSKNQANQDTSRYDDITLRSNYSNVVKKLKYDAGYDISLQRGTSGKIPNGSRQINDYALYQNIAYQLLHDRLALQASFRESYNTQYNAPLIYAFQALYTPFEKMQIRASYANGFRAPTLKEQYLVFVDNNHKIYGNENLKPETGNHLQASVSYQPYQHKGNYVQVVATGFYNDVNNQIALGNMDPTNPNNLEYRYSNITHLRNVVGNVQVEQQWQNLNLVLEYGITHTYAEEYPAFSAGEFTARGNYFWKEGKVAFNAFYKYTGSSVNVTEGIDGIATYNGTVDGYHRLDGSLSRKFLNKKIEVIAGVKNILDVRRISGTTLTSSGAHTSSIGGTMLPRTFFTTVRLNLN